MFKKLVWKAWWALVGLSLLALGLGACGGGEEPGPAATQPAATQPTAAMGTRVPPPIPTPTAMVPSAPAVFEAAMGMDAVAGGEIDNSRTVVGPDPFALDVVVLDAGPGYQLYQFKVQWDPGVLAYDSQVDLTPEELNLCSTPTVREDTVFSGCARVVRGDTTFVGPVNRLTFHCVGRGTSTMRFVTIAEDPGLGSTLLGFGGSIIATATSDISVECTG